MNTQELIEQNVRVVIGDLTLQAIVLKARIAELEESIAQGDLDKQPGPEPKANGKHKEQANGQGRTDS